MEFQDKLQSLAGQPSGYLESLPKKVKRRVTVLQELQVGLLKESFLLLSLFCNNSMTCVLKCLIWIHFLLDCITISRSFYLWHTV